MALGIGTIGDKKTLVEHKVFITVALLVVFRNCGNAGIKDGQENTDSLSWEKVLGIYQTCNGLNMIVNVIMKALY